MFSCVNVPLLPTLTLQEKFKAASQYNSTDYDALSDDKNLINRAVAMHLIREGNFSVANEFLEEAGPSVDIPSHLQQEFHEMYTIISAMRKERDLGPAIAWAASKAPLLEARGSNLEFDLVRLQFVHLFLSPEDEDTEMQEDGKRPRKAEALAYSQKEFQRFYKKHSKDIERLMCAFIYPDLEKSPYSRPFQAPEKTWEEVACAFTKEFCSLLGLSAESPLYIAATAGAIALPTLLKMTSIMKEKRTEWTTQNELPVEIPLPPDYHFHPIFVCPVSKDQTTEDNPPMILPCGHVIARESLQRLAKGGSSVSLKCPYCPKECTMHQAKQVII